jgi:hexokinase
MVDYQMLKESLEMFQLDGDSWKAVADEFKREIDLAEAGGSSSLKILPAFLSPPSGNEKGNYTAIDFGGSNLRVMQVQLLGLGLYRVCVFFIIIPQYSYQGGFFGAFHYRAGTY